MHEPRSWSVSILVSSSKKVALVEWHECASKLHSEENGLRHLSALGERLPSRACLLTFVSFSFSSLFLAIPNHFHPIWLS